MRPGYDARVLREAIQTVGSSGKTVLEETRQFSDQGRAYGVPKEQDTAIVKPASLRSSENLERNGCRKLAQGRQHSRKTMRRNSPRVLLVLGWYDYRLHRGIERFAQERGWHLSEDLAREKVIPWGWEGEGILAWLGAGDDLADFVVNAEKPTVDFSFRRSQLSFARVLEDTTAAARLVADHFLSRGFLNFAFYSDVHNWVYEERGTAFLNALEHAGQKASWLCWHESSSYCTGRKAWVGKRKWLANQLKILPKPIGVFAASDGLALELLEICEAERIAVPEEVAIVGAGNSLLAVDGMRTPISSVDVDMERIGYCGAQLLDELMRGKAVPAKPLRVPPFRLIARKSSDLVAVDHPGIARGLRYMWEHCHEPIGVNDLAKAALMSERNFRQAFVEHFGRPPSTELHRMRIELAKRLLSDSDEKMDVVAELCGYESANSFWVAFKRTLGISPKQYQQQLRSGRRSPQVAE
jgi:LacI family transcriptional regulator